MATARDPRRFARTQWVVLAAIVVLAAVVRVLYARRVGTAPLLGDGLEFHLAGGLLGDGRGFVDPFRWARGISAPTADKPPLYTMTLGALSALGLRSPGEHHASGVLTGVLLIGVVAALAREVSGRPSAALLAAGACAVYPPLVMADGSLRSESLFALLVACAVLAALRWRRRPGLRRAAVAGAAVALAALTRGEAILLLVLIPLALAGGGGAAFERVRVRHIGAFLAVAVAVLAPWLVRCWVTFDEPVAISTNTGGLLAGANCAETYSGALLGQWSFACLGRVDEPNEARGAAVLRARGLRYAVDHADRLPVVLAARLGNTLELRRPRTQALQQGFFEGRDVRVAQLAVPAFWAVALLAAVALGLRAVSRGDAWLLLAPVAVVAFVTVTAYGWPRFRAGAEPVLLVLAACGALALADRVRPVLRRAAGS